MDYETNLQELTTYFKISEENYLAIAENGLTRWIVVSEGVKDYTWWITCAESQGDALDIAEHIFTTDRRWRPTWLVDLNDGSAQEITMHINVGLGAVVT